MEPIVFVAIAVLILLIILRIFFKLAKFVLVIGFLIVVAVVLWNLFVAA